MKRLNKSHIVRTVFLTLTAVFAFDVWAFVFWEGKGTAIIIIFLPILIPLVLIVSVLALLQNLFSLAVLPAPEVPDIKYAEFPFEIVYSIDGETFEFNDVYVCKYKGIDLDYTDSKILVWNTYLKHSDTEHVELMPYNSSGSLCLYLGSPEYYMMGSFPGYGEHVPGEYIHHSLNHKREEISFEEAKEEYGLEIISTKFSEPIENKLEYRTIDKIRLFLFGAFFEE